jgi:hypothetical protein
MNQDSYGPPRDNEAEWAVLSACFTDPIILDRNKAEILDPHNYYQPVARCVARGLRDGVPPDAVAMGEFVAKEHQKYVHEFSLKIMSGSITSASKMDYWLPRLRKTTRMRNMHTAALKALGAMEEQDACPEDIRNILAGASKPWGSGNLPLIMEASALDELAIEKPEEIIFGALHRGCKMVLGGTSKSMKTWTLLQLAICVASGTKFWEMPTRKTRVLFINFEIQQYSFRERIRSVCRALGIQIPNDQLFVWNLRGHSADLSALRPKIIDQLRIGEFGLICFDPIYKLYGERDENSAGEMATLMNEVDSIAVETNASVVFGHHFSKGHGNRAGFDKMSGSTVFARDPDSIFVMHPHKEENVLIVEPTMRDFSPIDPFCVQWEFPLMKRTAEFNPDDARPTEGSKKAYEDDEVMACVDKEKGSSFKEVWEKADPAMGIPRGTLSRYLTRLVKSGKLMKDKSQFGEVYRVPAPGF